MAKLYAFSDLHVAYKANREFLAAVEPRSAGDWLIIAGDVGETEEHLNFVFSTLGKKFGQLVWVPGNHELWKVRKETWSAPEKYRHLCDLARSFGVATPEDPFISWQGDDGDQAIIAPLTLLYDYSFCPEDVSPASAISWAAEHDIRCADEDLIDPAPFSSIRQWCHARADLCKQRLAAAADKSPVIIVNHFPLRYDLVRLPRIPRFSIWCGTRLSESWHVDYNARAVVCGHLHMRGQTERDGVPFYEVSTGYPRDWQHRGITPADALVEIAG